MPGSGYLLLWPPTLSENWWRIMMNIQSILTISIGISYRLPIRMDMPIHSLMTDCGEKIDLIKVANVLALISTGIGTFTGEVT